ncbi:MAG: hypothetical protein KatS3mg102_2398 [Planctomycetota bacterium]|nr:MAG: hypothetical protein KatS3mg102_2398 [Planctomycetota bacterium]
MASRELAAGARVTGKAKPARDRLAAAPNAEAARRRAGDRSAWPRSRTEHPDLESHGSGLPVGMLAFP